MIGTAEGGRSARLAHRLVLRASGGAEGQARKRVLRFLAARPGWNLRLYRTPAGLRAMATHEVFAADDPAVQTCFEALHADPLYATMCRNQRCFRARVSAKPWRIGIPAHLRPRPGVWPVAAERLPARRAWIEHYDRAAGDYAACSFLESLGSGRVHPSALAVQQLHDELCRAHASKPLA